MNDKTKSATAAKGTETVLADEKQFRSRLQECPIAVIGMASVFANSKNLEQFWDNISEGVDSIIDVPSSRWSVDDYYSDDKRAADKTYCKRGGFLPEIDFDPMEFGLPPNILELTDIAQLLSLVVARDVLNDAGIGDDSGYDRDKVGITLGVGGGQKQITALTSRLQGPVLERVLASSGIDAADSAMIIEKFKKAYIGWEENSFPGMLGNVIAGRIANRFDFGGTNCVVDAACAGSLAAIKMAVSDLLEYRSEVMISGGVCCDNSPFMYMSFSKTPAFTPNDDIRPFDADSKGMMIGEGIGMMAFKRLEDAERDGDKVYAVLKGIGTSSDGRFKSIYAPRSSGQAKALKRAYDDAGFDPKSCGLIEAHGTGTMAGDAAEFGGLTTYFGAENETKQHIALGSVKSQIGHTKSAAGSAGMIKAILALHHKVLPPTIHIDQPNPSFDIKNTPFFLNSETRPWMPREDGLPRRAGISSFGFGGTNFHVVLEEYKPRQEGRYRLNVVPQTVLISAADEAGIIAELNGWHTKLSAGDGEAQHYAFNDLVSACELKSPDAAFARCGFVAKEASEALDKINAALKHFNSSPGEQEWSTPSSVYYRQSAIETKGKVVALFSGQGSQYVNMGRDLACNFPPILQTTAAMDDTFSAADMSQLSSTTYPIPVFSNEDRAMQEDKLRLTQYAQPAIGTLSVGLYKTFTNAGFKADFTAGHSFGELTALWAAGVISETDFMMLARSRGAAMAAPESDSANDDFDAGTMVAVVGDPKKVAADIEHIKDVSIANYNSNNQVVVAGTTDQVAVAFTALKQKGYKVIQLPVSAAFHTPLVGHAQKPFAKAVDKATFSAPAIPVFSNATGKAHSNKASDIKKSLKSHILHAVHFDDEINNLYAEGGRVFIEFGPKHTLSKLVENILKDKTDVTAIAINPNAKKSADMQMRLAALQMVVLGVELGNIDPYCAVKRPTAAPKMSPLAMKLSAASYVSPKTRKEYEDALNDGRTVKQAIAAPVATETKVVEKIVEKIVYVPTEAASQKVIPNQTTANNVDLVAAIETSVGQFVECQQQLLSVHEQYMQGPQDYAKTFQSVLDSQAGATELPESVDRTLAMYHEFQTDTLRMHERYLNSQTDNMSAMLGSMPEPGMSVSTPAIDVKVVAKPLVSHPVASASPSASAMPVGAAQAPAVIVAVPQKEMPVTQSVALIESPAATVVLGLDSEKIQKVMLEVVAEKTGYPPEMLELEMDMEADLGIDSIKRVEILGAVQETIPDLPELNPEDLAELRTLGEIVDYMQSKVQSGVETPVSQAVMTTSAPEIDLGKIQSVMMSVVAEKTGYPPEMLELEMDMEADLGIDSIKRVEILGAVQETIPDLPELNPEDLAELRTLGEIVDYMQSKVKSGAGTPVSQAVMTTSVPEIDLGKIQSVMMSVVAEKTGYPPEMLELEMDMEADLGIDSIKRVEILGAVQETIPDLPELNPEDLAELRTLGEIVDYMQSKVKSGGPETPVPQAVITTPAPEIDLNKIQSVMMSVVAEKTGYPPEMLELEMDMEADLGIDSIKRVEILGAVQETIPDLPELNPEDLAELRTLGEIVEYMQSKVKGSSVVATTAVVAAPVDSTLFSEKLIQVVAEKTGYPQEMLELDMDMEADLGIDSIKRVEILGAVQEAIEGLPEVEPETLAEMRTLAEIVACFSQQQTPEVVNASAVKAVSFDPAPSATVEIERLPAIIQIQQNINNAHVLLVDDGTGSTVQLASKLIKNGWKVSVLRPQWIEQISKKSFVKAVKVIPLDKVDESEIKHIIDSCGALDGVIHMQSPGSISGIEYPIAAKQGLELAFVLAKYCGVTEAKHARPSFMVVTRQGGSLGVAGNNLTTDLVQGGLNGLLKTLSHEWPGVFCRSVDLPVKLSSDKVAVILADELLDADTVLNEVAYDSEGRLTLIAEVSDSYKLSAGQSINDQSVFLVSGGAKGVTAHCVIRLAKEYQCRFILLGRSAHDSKEPDWATGITAEADLKKSAMQSLIAKGDKPTPVVVKQLVLPVLANREISQTVQAITAAGGQAEYVSVDVTKSKQLQSTVKPLIKKFGEITGIIHGAGVLADKFIEQKTLEEFDRVYRTKIDGLISLLSCADVEKIQHLVLFSSAAGFYGNPGQSDYSIANEILNKTAYRFKALHPQAQVLSFNWGPWDGGMVTAELKRMFNERGVYIIPLDAGAELLLNELAADANRCPQILVGNDLSSDNADKKEEPLKKSQLVA